MNTERGPILIVEDDEDMAGVLAQAIETLGYRGSVARNGSEGLAAIGREHPSLILLDMMMPVMDGRDFRERQLKMPQASAIPVVVMTADGRAQETAKELGAAGFLRKPITIQELTAALQSAGDAHPS